MKIPLVPENPVDERLVVEALLIVAVPVVLVLVNVAPVAERLVVEALRAVKLVVEAVTAAKRVEVALVMTEEVANTLVEKRLANRKELEPRERVLSVVGRISAAMFNVEKSVV